MSSPYSADTIERRPARRLTLATVTASQVVESDLDRVGINLLWVVAPICATIVFVLLMALIVVLAIRSSDTDTLHDHNVLQSYETDKNTQFCVLYVNTT